MKILQRCSFSSSIISNNYWWFLSRQHLIWLLYSSFIFLPVLQAKNAFEAISENPELSTFKELLSKNQLMFLMVTSMSVTVVAPNNKAIQAFYDKNGPDSFSDEMLTYHIAAVSIKRKSFLSSQVATLAGKIAPWYLSVVNGSIINSHKSEEKSYYVNNALIIESIEDLQSRQEEPQTLYVADEVLSIFKHNLAMAPNALELINDPSIYNLNNLDLSRFLHQIKEHRLESLFTAPGANTFFIPTNIGSKGAEQFDEYVIKAHVIKSKALFVRTMPEQRAFNTLAYDDKVQVELCFIDNSVRFNSQQNYYIQTNTVKNDEKHKAGRVSSRLAVSNIPVKNGVIHIIEKPLMLMDMTVRDFLREQAKLGKFNKLLDKHRDLISEMENNPRKTILAPDDNAFANLMENNPSFASIGEDSAEMKKLLREHIVYQLVSSIDLKSKGGFANLTSAAGAPVMFRLTGSDPHTRLTVESGGVNATSALSDYGTSDGIVHQLDRVLGMPFNTIYEKLINNPMLNETFKIGSQGGTQNWNAKLADQNKRYTFFAPSNEAWMLFSQDNPSEFKQLDTGIYPAISRAILDRHLSAKGQFNKKELEQKLKKVDTIQGELLVKPDPVTRDIYIEWEGKKAKIIKSDMYGLNGVVHVIDQVLAKRRDFKVNSSNQVFNNHCHVLLCAIMGLLTIMMNPLSIIS